MNQEEYQLCIRMGDKLDLEQRKELMKYVMGVLVANGLQTTSKPVPKWSMVSVSPDGDIVVKSPKSKSLVEILEEGRQELKREWVLQELKREQGQ